MKYDMLGRMVIMIPEDNRDAYLLGQLSAMLPKTIEMKEDKKSGKVELKSVTFDMEHIKAHLLLNLSKPFFRREGD